MHIPQVSFPINAATMRHPQKNNNNNTTNKQKTTLLTPCLVPSPRWACHLIQVKIELEAKMSRRVRASRCGTGIESTWVLWVTSCHPPRKCGPVPQISEPDKFYLWGLMDQKKKKAPICMFLFKFSSHDLPRMVHWINGPRQRLHIRGSTHQSLSWKVSWEGTEQAYLELGNCVILLKPAKVQITPQMFHGVVRKVHTPTVIISGNILFSKFCLETDVLLCLIICVSCVDTFLGLQMCAKLLSWMQILW